MALIEFKNVNKYYGDYHALRDINLEIEKGQVVVLLGPSGSGKSTLIRTINALESIDNGTLIVNGHNVTEASAKDLVELRKEAGMVFQHFNLYPHKTVLENVTLAPIKVLGISKAEAEKTAEKFLRYVNRILTCHRIHHEDGLMYGHSLLDLPELLHHAFVNVETSCCIEDDDVVAVLCRMFQGCLGNIRRLMLITHGKHIHTLLFSVNLELLYRCRPINVTGN